MSKVNLKINGKTVQAPAGSTILEAARLAEVDIPVLCHHPKLANLGSCRICLVEIARQPNLHPACTYPVFEGMEVQTESPRVVEMRKFVLDMLFSERNHHCMYCEMSGDCELQNLAYRYRMDRWSFPSPHPHMPVDATRKYFLLDHSRCILCRRCLRACSDLAANHTLGVKNRGADTMICADMDLSFGESSCVSCGTCLEVCPTGALVDRRSAYMGRTAEVQRVRSSCAACSLGCGVELVVRGGQVLRVESDWDRHNEGVLCVAGRFEPLEQTREKITRPLVRRDGQLQEATWVEALDALVSGLRQAAPGGIRAVTSGAVLSEGMNEFVNFFKGKMGVPVHLLEPALAGSELAADGGLKDVDAADFILVAGGDPLASHRVLGYRIKRAIDKGAEVWLVSGKETEMAHFAARCLGLAELDSAVAHCMESRSPVVVYGADLTAREAGRLARLRGKARFIPLAPSPNGHRAQVLGLEPAAGWAGAKALFVLLESALLQEGWLQEFRRPQFLAVYASCRSPLTDQADVVLPALQWYERQGTFINMEGRNVDVHQAVEPGGEGWSVQKLFDRLSGCMT